MKAKFYKNFQIAKCFLFAFFIFHFSFFIFGCSSSTSSPKGSLSGSVSLEGLSDHSNITVSLYDLAYLDTTIVRINREYPHIGVIINQHTEFDHRLQSPVATSTTVADGSFIIEDVPTGVYNFVAQKAGWGFRYIYEISISEGDNEISSMCNEQCIMNNAKANVISTENSDEALAMTERRESAGMKRFYASSKSRSEQEHYSSFIIHSSLNRISDLTLYPELHISGDVNDAIVVAPYHHLVCDDDVTFVPGSRLEIQPNAVVRIAPGADLTIMGSFKAQGEENNMFWVTTNDGFADDSNLKLKKKNVKLDSSNEPERNDNFTSSILNFTFNRDSDLGLYNSMELSPLATVENDLIEWGKWDWGNTCLLNKVNNVTMQNGIFRNGSCGFYSSNVGITNCSNLLAVNCWGESDGAIYYNEGIAGNIEKNIILSSPNGIKIKGHCEPLVKDSYISDCNTAIDISYYSYPDISNNDLEKIINGIYIKEYSCPTIENNNIINAESCIKTYRNYSTDSLMIHHNNLKYMQNSFLIGWRTYTDIDAENNYFFTIDELEIIESIFDKNDVQQGEQQYYSEVLFQPFLIEPYPYAGVQIGD